jgi:superfamily II DNA or RNA helicase
MQLLPDAVRSGLSVNVRGEPWIVADVDEYADARVVTLRGLGQGNHGDITRVLLPFDRATPIHRRRRLRHVGRRRALGAVAASAAPATPWLDCHTVAAARIDCRAWQLEPARAVLAGATRLLLADEVGLGKTIQAILVATELGLRGLARRVLVLTPAALREQWAEEMRDRFGLAAEVFDHVSLAAMLQRLPVGVNPWNTAPCIVSSIDLVKRPEVRQSIDRAAFDLLIIDEAHHLTPGSARAHLVEDLALRTPFVVLVTATPHSGDNDAYRTLLAIGDAGDAGMTVFRRRACDVHPERSRRTRLVAVTPTALERQFLETTLAYARATWQAPGGPAAALVATVIARRACSSPRAALRTLERRLATLAGTPEADDQPRLPWDEAVEDDDVPEAVIAAPGLCDRGAEIAWLERLVAAARDASGHSSKLANITRLLRRSSESLLIFSEYRDVALLVAESVAAVTSVAVLHGGQSPARRRELVALFNRGQIRTLVSTDAAGEGLNLQQRCRLVVTLELPWNPLRLEQRIGRVDRLGQHRRVHVRHLLHRGSFEDVVLARLEQRRLSAATALDETSSVTERDVAAMVLGDAAPITFDQRASRGTFVGSGRVPAPDAGRHVSLTVPGGRPARPIRTPVYASRPPARSAARHVTLAFATAVVDARGRTIESTVVAVRSAVTGDHPRRLTHAMVRALSRRQEIHARVREVVGSRVTVMIDELSPVATRLASRIEGLMAGIESRHRHEWFQVSLFDDREAQAAHSRREVAALWQEHLRAHADRVRALRSLTAGEPQLIAAWLEA